MKPINELLCLSVHPVRRFKYEHQYCGDITGFIVRLCMNCRPVTQHIFGAFDFVVESPNIIIIRNSVVKEKWHGTYGLKFCLRAQIRKFSKFDIIRSFLSIVLCADLLIDTSKCLDL